MSNQENRNPQHSAPQKPAPPEQKPTVQPNQPVQQKPVVPIAQPKVPQSEPEKHDQPQKKHAWAAVNLELVNRRAQDGSIDIEPS